MYDILQLNDMLVPELLDIAEQMKIPHFRKLDKQSLIYRILDKQAVLVQLATKGEDAAKKGKRKRIVKTVTGKGTPPAPPAVPAQPVQGKAPILKIQIDPGTAPNEEIAEILIDISRIYRQMGGNGIEFKFDHVSLSKEEPA